MMKRICVAACLLVVVSITALLTGPDAIALVYSSISGRAIGEDTGQGVANVTVLALLVGGDRVGYHYASTDGHGVYVLKDLTPGTYLISFFKEGSHYLRSYPNLEVVLPKGKHVVNANHVLTVGGSVSGTVYGADGVTTMNGVRVSADVPVLQPVWVGGFKATLTDNNGRFLLQGLQESSNCTVRAKVQAHATLTKTATIQKGKTTANVNFIVKWDDVTGIGGYVKSSIDNKPVKDASVILRDGLGDEIGSAFTDETGRYSIAGVSPGTYKAAAFWPTGEYDTVYKENITVTSGKQTTVDFYFNAPAPISRVLNWLKNMFADFLVARAHAGDGYNDLEFGFKSCEGNQRDLLKKAYYEVKLLVKFDPCMDSKIRDSLKKKLRERTITIYCVPVEEKECKEQYSKAEAGAYTTSSGEDKNSDIFFCPYAFTWDKNKRICIGAVLFHELVHSIGYSLEAVPTACERECFYSQAGCFNKSDGAVQERFKDYKDCKCDPCCKDRIKG